MAKRNISVKQGGIRRAKYPNTLYTENLGPCFSLVIYDPKTQSGYLCHSSGPEIVTLEETAKRARSLYSELSCANAVVTGGNKEGGREGSEGINRTVDICWNFLYRKIPELGFDEKNVRYERSDEPDITQDVKLDCETGDITVKTFRHEELFGDDI